MKQTLSTGWLVFLVSASVLVWCWNIVVLAKAKTLITMFNMAAPSSAQYDRILTSVCEDSTKLLCCAAIPMALVTLLWVFAFLSERKKNRRLERQLSDLQPGPTR